MEIEFSFPGMTPFTAHCSGLDDLSVADLETVVRMAVKSAFDEYARRTEERLLWGDAPRDKVTGE